MIPTAKITEVEIRSSDSPLGNKAAWVVLDDGTKGLAFSWFDSRIHFDESELLGLTLIEAHHLRHAKHKHN